MNRHGLPYTPSRGGLLTLILHKYAFPGNITKIPTPARISPYLQIININNHPNQPWLILNLYMPSYEEDLHLLLEIQASMSQYILASSTHTILLCGDFNRDIALLGRHHANTFLPPSHLDNEWRTYVNTLNLTYIPTDTPYTRQSRDCYTNTSLFDGFFLKSPNIPLYHSHTNTTTTLNSDHFPIYLHVPPHSLLSKPPLLPIPHTPRILNPIPTANLTNFNTQFFETNALQIDTLIAILQQDQLHDHQWLDVCSQLDILINSISTTILATCTAPPLSPLTSRTAQ
jgi:hypothetical protein